jgi:hypothetical protein
LPTEGSHGGKKHQGNMRVHAAQVAVTEAANCGFKMLHPPYSKDLASSELFLFPKLNSKLCGCHFLNDNDVIHAVEAQLQAQDTPFLPGRDWNA